MVDVPVNPEVLKWAREERRLTLQAAAEKSKLDVADITAFETVGGKRPTLTALRKLAGAYQLPVATLLMPEPLPSDTRPKISDYRTLDGRDPTLSHTTQVALEIIDEQLTAFADIRESDPALVPIPELPKFSITEKPEDVAIAERKRVRYTVDAQINWHDEREAFLRWRQWVEAQGIFVYLLKMDLRDCRGFSVWDDRQVAAIAINASESEYKYKNFSLLHEYAHLLLRMGGISDEKRNNRVERFCNQFAAYFLMPRVEFTRTVKDVHREGEQWGENKIARLSSLFSVSKSSITYHLEDLGLAAQGHFNTMRAELRKRRKRDGGGIATHIEKHANRLGARPVEVVTRAVDAGKLSKLDAYELLDVKPDYFAALKEEIAQRRAHFGAGG